MIGSIIRRFVKTAYIAIIKDGDTCDVCVKILKNKTEISRESKRFSIQTRESAKLLDEFVKNLLAKYSIFYTATIINSINQGGVPGCDKKSFEKYEIDTTNASVICIDKKWSIFASNYDIESTQKEFEELGGLDCLFSSIVVLKSFFDSELDSTPTMCILKQKTSATIAIFTKDSLLFSNYIILKADTPQGEENETKKQEEKIFGEEDEFDEEKLVDLDDIALDLKEDNSEMSEFMNIPSDEQEDVSTMSIESLGSDLRILDFVKTSLNQFYKNPMYESSFIEKISIADPYFESPDIKNLLENEIMLPVTHKKIELCDITSDLAIEEVLY
ncbi:MAG: hypothetical protein JHC37_00125 [Campylobacteraceae bacterium]|nr:hypothetical protein [Campylobacteraceae bacterium]